MKGDSLKILCHVGPWCVEQYRTIAMGVDKNAEIQIVSGFKKLDETRLVEKYYDYVSFYNKQELDVDQLYKENLDIVLRCRLLRSLIEKDSVVHVLAMRRAIQEILDAQKPDLIISETIDQFLMDILYIEAKNRKIPFFGLVITFVNGYYRFSAKGEFNIARDVTEDEVYKVLALLENKAYKPKFVKQSLLSTSLSPYKQWAKNIARIPYFFVKRLLTGERYNYHYWASLRTSIDNFSILPQTGFNHNNWQALIKDTERKQIFIPLQYYPEATIEYWCASLSVIDYEKLLFETVERLSKDFCVIIKEHPNVVGLRSKAFYKQLDSIENVIICPAAENSNQIIDAVDAVLVWTGSVGFESALRGKPVLSLCDPYYASGRSFKLITYKTPNKEIANFIQNFRDLNEQEKFEMVAYLLRGIVPGKYKNDWSWSNASREDVNSALTTGEHIDRRITSIKV